MSNLRPRDLTWTALLARWLDFARASVALPDNAEGEAWKASIAPIITLQAVTFALGELPDLPVDEHALGLDRAEIQIRGAAAAIAFAWSPAAIPISLSQVLADAEASLALARRAISSTPLE